MSVAAVLARKRRWARMVLRCEQLATPLAPTGAIMLALVCAGMLGLPQALAPWVHAGVLVGALGLGAAMAWARVAPLARPTAGDVDRRLERGAGDPHRPLATLADRPAAAGAEAVWEAHRSRALGRIGALRAGRPQLRATEAAGLASGAVLLLACGILAGPGATGRLFAAFTPRLRTVVAAAQVQATIVAPPGLGMAPLFLAAHGGDAVRVPAGARLSVTVLGGGSLPGLRVAGAAVPFRRLDASGYVASAVLERGGVVAVTRGGRVLGRWTLEVAADRAPEIRLVGAAGNTQGRAVLPWMASDDYGLAGVAAEIRLRDRPTDMLMVRLVLAGMPRAASGGTLPDLTSQPWAGLPVRIRYVARDGGGQSGTSAEAVLTLPERQFANPLARALIGVRRGLSVDPAATAAAGRALDRLSAQAAGRVTGGQWLNLRAAAALLAAPEAGGVTAAQARLWMLALSIEDGGTGDTRRALADARHALEDALVSTGADRQQRIEAASAALRTAIGRYLQALEQQAARNDAAPRAQAAGRSVDAAQIDQMARQLADAARSGRTDSAAAQLRALGALLDGLRAGGARGTAGRGAPPDPALSALLHDQDQLRAHSAGRLSQEGDPRASDGPERDPDEATGAADPTMQRGADAAAQARLRSRLGELAGELGERTGQVPDGLAQADGAMRQAAGALARGDDGAARAAQQRAIDGLRQGGRQMAGEGTGAAGMAQPGPGPGPGADPVGRESAGDGDQPDEDRDGALPADADAARGRALRDELRRRAADRARPAQELDYIDRLLKPQ